MFRLYAKQLKPNFELYVSPVNIDPSDPELPITAPESYSKKLAKEVGLFYTQGMAQDTAAYSRGFSTGRNILRRAVRSQRIT